MYSRAIVALAVAAAAAPAIAIPLAARDAPVDTTASGALNLDQVGKAVNIGNDVISGITSIKNFFENNKKREFEELLARAAATADDGSGAIDFKSIFSIGGDIVKGVEGISSLFSSNNNQQPQQRRELEELFARAAAAADDGSGALSLGVVKDAVSIGSDVITGIQNIKDLFTNQQRREFEALLARELPTDESGAINFGSLFKIGGDIVSGISSLFGGSSSNQQQQSKRELSPVAREVHDLLARQVDQSGASIFGDIVKVGGSLLSSLFGGSNNQQQRDAPAPTTSPSTTALPASASGVQVQLPTDASGAIDFKKIISTVGTVASTVLPFFLKREEMELLARQTAGSSTSTAPAGYPTDASGAIDFKSILSDVGSVASTVLPFFLKREELELLARQAVPAASSLPTDASGAIDFKSILSDVGSVASTVLPFFLKREEMELLARQVAASSPSTDASGAIDFKSVLSDVGKVATTVLPFFLKREEELLAREALSTAFGGLTRPRIGVVVPPGGFHFSTPASRSLNELD